MILAYYFAILVTALAIFTRPISTELILPSLTELQENIQTNLQNLQSNLLLNQPPLVPITTTITNNNNNNNQNEMERIPCQCGVFLNGQFKRGSNEQPKGNPALLQELADTFQCNAVGEKQCTNKCLETIMRHLPNSPVMVCGSIDRDCFKERAYLFVKNCKDSWTNTNLSAGREYCCKEGYPYKCP